MGILVTDGRAMVILSICWSAVLLLPAVSRAIMAIYSIDEWAADADSMQDILEEIFASELAQPILALVIWLLMLVISVVMGGPFLNSAILSLYLLVARRRRV